MTQHSLYRQLPAIDQLLNQPAIIDLLSRYGQTLIVDQLRQLQQQARSWITQHQQLPDWHTDWAQALAQALDNHQRSGLQPVINLTGTVLHTNLGRALLAEEAIEQTIQAMRCPITLEYDLESAGRGHRDDTLSKLLQELTGAEAACIVNNNAAAVLLILATLAPAKQVIVSRGELIEIGGAFRIPDVMRQAGCQLVEVGTTNRTHLTDYRHAITEQTALLMKVHTSNYTIQGFTQAVSEAELVELGHQQNVPVISDLGSGSLVNLTDYHLPEEPMPQSLIKAGVDLISFSGDKLLGGPQAGIIVGRRTLIEQLQQHPLKRALRAGKLTLAALEATLRLYQNPSKLRARLPTLRLLTRTPQEIWQTGQCLLPALTAHFQAEYQLLLEPCLSQIGSGSLPVERLPSYALTFSPHSNSGQSLTTLAEYWRQRPTPVIGRIQAGKFWLDLRCLECENDLLEMLSQ